MHLTREEESILNGEHGWANQTCMKILVRLGELFNASRLIPISSAHASGVSYKTLGDAPIEFLETLTDAGAKTRCRATLNPQSLDPEYLPRRLPAGFSRKQARILDCFERMGFTKSLTCTPYYLDKPPRGAHIAWAESSAVIYANSVLGAWTNREGGPSALAAATIGKTPDYGVHLAENRLPQVEVEVKTELSAETDFGALGILLGEILEDKIPAVQGLGKASADNLKQLGAALASTGMVNMFCSNCRDVWRGRTERVTVGSRDLKQVSERLNTSASGKPDLIFLGCPHYSLEEVKRIAELIDGRKVKEGVEFWVCTSQHVREKADRYVRMIERCGARIITDTCAVVTWTDRIGIRTIMTNSAKTAHYAPTLNKAEAIFAPLSECLKTALKG